MPSPGISGILAGDYTTQTIKLARSETFHALSDYNEDYARAVLAVLQSYEPVDALPRIRRSIFQEQGIVNTYDRSLDDEWRAPSQLRTEAMLGVVCGPRTLEADYETPIPSCWRQRTPLLKQHRVFWYGAYLFAILALAPGLSNWSTLVQVISSAFQLGVALDYSEKLRFDEQTVGQIWRDIAASVELAREVDRLDVLATALFTSLMCYPNHCGNFETDRVIELRNIEVGSYIFARTVCADHSAAMCMGAAIGLAHDLLESGTDIANREVHNGWSLLTNGCCCPVCVKILEQWLLKWMRADPATCGYQIAWGAVGFFLATWINERHGISTPMPSAVTALEFRRCDGAPLLKKVLAAADQAGIITCDVKAIPACGRHVEDALPTTARSRRITYERFAHSMFSAGGRYCGCLHQSFISHIEANGLYDTVRPWIRKVTPATGRRPDR